MEKLFITLLGVGVQLWWLIGAVLAFVFFVLYPLLVLSAVRNVKGIRSELARLNSNVERLALMRLPNTPSDSPADDLPLYVPGTHTRTGPLDIR